MPSVASVTRDSFWPREKNGELHIVNLLRLNPTSIQQPNGKRCKYSARMLTRRRLFNLCLGTVVCTRDGSVGSADPPVKRSRQTHGKQTDNSRCCQSDTPGRAETHRSRSASWLPAHNSEEIWTAAYTVNISEGVRVTVFQLLAY